MSEVTAHWLRLGALIDDDPEVTAALQEAARSSDDLRSALLDAVDDAGALAYMEWADSGVELADALAQLPRVFRAGIDTDEVGDVDGSLERAIAAADRILARAELRIIYLDEGSDACPLVVVACGDVAEIHVLADRLGWPVRTFG